MTALIKFLVSGGSVWMFAEGEDRRGRQMAGCVPVDSAGRLVCLVTSRHHPSQLILPKGGVEPGEGAGEAAMRETAEEAGLRGRLGRLLCEVKGVKWYVLHVEEEWERWPEMSQRRRHWVREDGCFWRFDLQIVG